MQPPNCLSPDSPPKRPADHWFVAHLKPGGFEKAKRNLARQRFETFMPMLERTVRHARQTKCVRRPLFEGYLFVRFNPETTAWRAINGTLGVNGLITAAQRPQQAPEALMSALVSRCDSTDLVLYPEPLAPGDKVTLLEGPFRDFVATVASCPDQIRVRILIELLGRSTTLECPREQTIRV